MAKRTKGGIPTPDVIDPPESMQMTLCIPKNKDHMMAFFGALWELTMWDSWQPDEAHTGKELAAVWYRYWLSWDRTMNDILCEVGNMNCCTEPAITRRVNPITGKIEQSTDGGTHWTDGAGGLDSVIVEPVPPVTSGVAATKCDAATNLSEQVQVWIDQVSTDFTTAENLVAFATAVFEAILVAVLVALSAGTLTGVAALVIPTIGAALAAAWGAGKAVFDAYWTTENKQIIFCAGVCNIGDDGSFTDAQFSAYWNKCNSDLPPSPAKMLFMGFLSSVGKAGLNAMAASGFSADADCSSCECVPATCVNKWHTSLPHEQYGTITVDEEDGSFTVEAGLNGSTYTVIMFTGDGSDNLNCCNMMDNEMISGSLDNRIWYNCGSDTSTTGIPGWECVYDIQLFSAAPFTVKFSPTDC